MKFVDKQLAIKLKEKGFDKPCFGYYQENEFILNKTSIHLPFGGDVSDIMILHQGENDIVDAPTIEQVLEWLRKEKKIHLVIDIKRENVYESNIWGYFVVLLNSYFGCVNHYDFESDSYEDACIEGIKYIVEHLI